MLGKTCQFKEKHHENKLHHLSNIHSIHLHWLQSQQRAQASHMQRQRKINWTRKYFMLLSLCLFVHPLSQYTLFPLSQFNSTHVPQCMKVLFENPVCQALLELLSSPMSFPDLLFQCWIPLALLIQHTSLQNIRAISMPVQNNDSHLQLSKFLKLY